ncbi:MAG: PadR family transcriptional regulator [Candidatus Aminicenantes bacterium]|nr:PadR family transcriptional regulator [Candidatus Aminicenantes bacterium]
MADDISPFETEMNRGFLQVLILVLLEQKMYGYSIIKTLKKKGFVIEENTLYPLLRRLEKKDLIQSQWDVSDQRPRKFYIISKKGRGIRRQLLNIWHSQNKVLIRLIKENKNA